MGNGDNEKTRYHAEVKISILGHEARINVFADTLTQVFKDIATIIQQYPGNVGSARREIANAELKADQVKPNPNPPPKPPAPASDSQPLPLQAEHQPPICQDCGTDEFMELIRFKDKKTGKPREAWKCQQCNKWHWDDNGKGR